MEHRGRYSKGRRKITQPVLTVPEHVAAAPKADESSVKMDESIRGDVEAVTKATVKQLDKNRYILRKTTGWLIAALVITALGAAAYLGAHFLTREHQVDHMQEQVRSMERQMDQTRKRQQTLEKRLVELETQYELMQE